MRFRSFRKDSRWRRARRRGHSSRRRLARRMEFVLGGAAAMAACLFTNPLEVAKTRMQLQGELRQKGSYAVRYGNVVHAMRAVRAQEGWLALQRGLAPALSFQLCMNGLRLGAYHWLQEQGFLQGSAEHSSALRSVAAAALAGCVGAAAGSPLYLVKTQMQASVGAVVSRGRTLTLLVRAYRHGGGLWRGCAGAMPRVAAGSAAQLTAFSKSVEALHTRVPPQHRTWAPPLAASVVAGLAVSVVMTPFDVVSTRLYNQGVDARGRGLLYCSWWDCVAKTMGSEGLGGFYKGWSANLARVGPHSVLCLFFWHQLRQLYPVSS